MQISRTSLPAPRIRAVRKSEWLRCALAHHFNPDPGVENEIVVLATGIDQYLQEIFHHLAFYSNDDIVTEEDFRLLCLVLGLTTEKKPAEVHAICHALPPVLNFREFHSRLCGFFTVKAQSGTTATRLPVTEETEHIEREISLRWPRVRKRKCVSFDLSREVKTSSLNASDKTDNLKVRKDSGLQQRTYQEQVELENAALRELVEDLRSALQSSDARCMALEVALRQERSRTPRQGCPDHAEPRAVRPPGRVCRRRPADLMRELELVRASRDGQLEEAMRFNQRLEEELAGAYAEAGRLGLALGSARRENAEIKRRAEEARGTMAACLERVRDLQMLAEQVCPLQEKVLNLRRELQQFRSHCTCGAEREQRAEPPEPLEPSGQHELFISGVEGLQRAVEGRAASDEEEEERDEELEQCCLMEVKRMTNTLHQCTKGSQKTAVCHLLLAQSSAHHNEACSCRDSGGEETTRRQPHTPPDERGLEKDLHQKQGELEGLRLEVQMVETERVRLSLLEEKLSDALSLMLQLRDRRVSRRALGKLLLDTLDLCSKSGSAPAPVFQVVDILCQQLTSSKLLCRAEKGLVRSHTSVSPELLSTTNPLLISC
ncbi:EF-hand and coiled-coil domain-containing protein 1 isoform X2 [Brachyhypopomus gauderio]|uniref:EF-hand and coiled-coil domain-containing protein 1 isoform X2 n=1 Tax=Brachyhypopomus gauderio TaxID=698409 RepID=UPI00404384F0